MNRAIRLLLSMFLLLQIPFVAARGQSVFGHIRSGNRAYKKGEYKAAELSYRKAQELDSSSMKSRYNLAASLYKQERYDEAERRYSQLALEQGQQGGGALSQDALYNAANSLFKEGKYDKSIEMYKQVLRANPRDEQARYNLSEALRRIERQKQEQQSQQSKDQEGQDKQNQQQQSKENKPGEDNKENRGDRQQEQQGSGQQREGENRNEGKTPPSRQPQQGQSMSEADAKRILGALEKQQGKAAEKVRKAKQQGGRPKRPEKDW